MIYACPRSTRDYIQSYVSQVGTQNTDYLLWRTQLIVCAVKYQIMV